MSYIAKPIGFQSLTWFPLLKDVKGEKPQYGPPKKIARAIKATLTPNSISAPLESDDGMEDDISMVAGFTINIDVSQISAEMRAELFGHTLDKNKGLLVKSTDVPTYGALAFRTLMSKQGGEDKYRYYILYKGSFKDVAETFETRKKDALTYQIHAGMEGNFYPRDCDGQIFYSVDETTEGVNAEAVKNWFTEVVESADGTTGESGTPAGTGV